MQRGHPSTMIPIIADFKQEIQPNFPYGFLRFHESRLEGGSGIPI